MSKEDRKETIREAATKVFSRQGFYETRADEIAQQAGVAVGTIYNYYKNKESILLDIFTTELEDRKKFYRKLSESGLPLVDQIQKILDKHFQQLGERQELMRVLLQERFKPGSQLGEKLTDHYRDIITYIEGLIDKAVDERQIRNCDSSILAHALVGMVESIVGYGLIHEREKAEKLFQKAPRELADFIIKGIEK